MNTEIAKDNWDQFTAKAKQKWGKFTDNDFKQASGKAEELVAKLQEYYHLSKEEAKKQIEEMMDEDGSEGASGSIGQKVGEMTSAAKTAFTDAAKAAQSEMKQAAQSVKEQGSEMSENLYNYVDRCMQEKPMTTLLVAVGVGALLGAIIQR